MVVLYDAVKWYLPTICSTEFHSLQQLSVTTSGLWDIAGAR